jgi:hypothetical protein
MAYAGDLKSPVLHRTCGFDPHPGHQIRSPVFFVVDSLRAAARFNAALLV